MDYFLCTFARTPLKYILRVVLGHQVGIGEAGKLGFAAGKTTIECQ